MGAVVLCITLTIFGMGVQSRCNAVAAPSKGLAAAVLTLAEEAADQLSQGQYRQAAKQTRAALQLAPNDPTLLTLTGAALINTGGAKEAQTVFLKALAGAPDDSLARYGLGLAQLANGDRAGALASFQRSAQDGGDMPYLLLAQRYTQWLNGAQIPSNEASLPDDFLPALRALQGMAAARQGDAHQIMALLESGLDSLPGDPILQPTGLLMTFDTGKPLSSETTVPLFPGGLDMRQPQGKALGGSLTVSPGVANANAAYVSYEADGALLSMVNQRPFAYTWDTRDVANGWHVLSITFYDQNGKQTGKTSRRIRIANAGGDAVVYASPEQTARLRTTLWKALRLSPDRAACSYTLGAACRTAGNAAGARLWFARAAAVRPDYRDTRQQLGALGGLHGPGDSVWGGSPLEKVIALTFDDGPRPGVTEPLLDVLLQYQVPATFFVVGRQAMLYPDLTRKISEAGMEIANHSYTHPNLTHLRPEEIAAEIIQTQAAVETLTGKTPRFLRPPGGNWNSEVARIARYWGLTPCFWTVDVYASEVAGAQQVADAVLAQVRPGSVVLMHNGKMSTVQALPTIIKTLRSRGYVFVTVDMLANRLAASKEAVRAAARLRPSTLRRVE